MPAVNSFQVQETYMTKYEKFDRLIRELEITGSELKKNWNSDASAVFCSSLDDSIHYIRKMTERFRDDPAMKTEEKKSALSDFSF